MILLAVILIGLLTAAIQSSSRPEGASVDPETLTIRASEVQRYAAELERAVNTVVREGVSEDDIRFAHYDAHADYGDITVADGTHGFTNQVFHVDGGAAEYRDPPAGINNGSAWEFYAGTQIPGIGTGTRGDLVAVLPNVTEDFCNKINIINGQTGTPADTGTTAAAGSDPGNCVNVGALGRFDAAQQYYDDPDMNTMNEATFVQDANTGAVRPAPQACVVCSVGGTTRHFYHVLLAR